MPRGYRAGESIEDACHACKTDRLHTVVVLEQQINASELPDDVKMKLQAYVSGCYGTLTSFNVLFADEHDQFKGSGGDY